MAAARESAALNKTGSALEYGNKSIVMKGWEISCASSPSSVVNYGRVSRSLCCFERPSASGWWPRIAPSAGTLAQFTTLRIQPGGSPATGHRRLVSHRGQQSVKTLESHQPRSKKETAGLYLPRVRNHSSLIAACERFSFSSVSARGVRLANGKSL